MEGGWLERMQDRHLYAYQLPAEPFRPHEVGGYWVAGVLVDAIDQVVIAGDHAGVLGADVENADPPERLSLSLHRAGSSTICHRSHSPTAIGFLHDLWTSDGICFI
jgi:hypothetical protein